MNVKKYFQIVLIATLVCVTAFMGVLMARIMVKPFTSGEHGDALIPVSGGKVNFLVVGADKVGYNTDTIMVATINLNEPKISLMSVPRDTKARVNGHTMKINAVYSYSKNTGIPAEETLIETVSSITGIGINYYAIVDTTAFREIVDALGGIEYNVRPQGYYYNDPLQDLYINIPGGKQILDGKQAEGLVRFRHDYARADLERVEIQQDVIKELIKQKLNIKYISKVPQIYKTVSDNVISNLKVGDIADYAREVLSVGTENIKTYTMPNYTQGGYVIPDDDEIELLVSEDF